MSKLLKIIFLILIVFLISKLIQNNFNLNSKAHLSSAIWHAYASRITKIPRKTVKYLKTSNRYGSFYNTNKKFAIYFIGEGCPYDQAFSNAVIKVAKDPVYQQYYNFFAIDVNQKKEKFNSVKEAQRDENFKNLCQEFCIVNPAKNQIYYIEGIADQDAANIKTTFDDLKNW